MDHVKWVIAIIGGIVTLITFKEQIIKFLRGSFLPRLTNPEKINKRESFRKEFEDFFIQAWKKNYTPNAIIRDVKRIDAYPEAQERKGISPWFKVGLLDNYYRGILVGLSAVRLISTPEGLRYPKSSEEGDVLAFKVGEIPFDSIERVNWDGDEYYIMPHIYCHFEHNKQPYERIIFCIEQKTSLGKKFYTEIATYTSVYQLSRKNGVTDFY